jgi:Ca2+-binding RTX toxin-like protein
MEETVMRSEKRNVSDPFGAAFANGNTDASVDAWGDWIDGGDGDDRIWGMAGDDIIIGGKGRDTYIFSKGDGVDEIWDDDSGPDKSILVFGESFDKNSIKLKEGSLLLDMGDGDAIHIGNWDQANPLAYQTFTSFQFADGSSLTWKSRRWRDGEAVNEASWTAAA